MRGIVQGVGFRPFVYGLARRLALDGFIRNTAQGVVIQVEGDPATLDAFHTELVVGRPRWRRSMKSNRPCCELAESTASESIRSETTASASDRNVRISPDVATCSACLRDLYDPANRRHLYPFITCATCGPRLTIVTGAPYDRERTTMARFTMCDACRREYDDPLDRRFHAETIACASCGPAIDLRDAAFRIIDGDPIARLAALLEQGQIAAIKGPGGYHLACDATSPTAVAELRTRKHRDEKPFAVMFDSLEAVERVCQLGDAERRILTSPARPIVVLRRRRSRPPPRVTVEDVAPGTNSLGAMLPSTPRAAPAAARGRRPLVMTSGNRSQEPVAIDDADAFERLAGIADVFLANDRPIHVRCDDRVSRVVGGRSCRCAAHAATPRGRSVLAAPCRVPSWRWADI